MRGWIAGLAALGLAVFGATGAQAQLCARWSAAGEIAQLDASMINEASGIAVSRRVEGRLYHNNDSGDGPYFYISTLSGNAPTQRVAVAGFQPEDVEDMALGPCGGGQTCLYLGDIGDNGARREQIRFVILREQETFGQRVEPLRTVNARYPEGPQDAESFAIHPNGDLYLVTKPRDLINRRAGVARVYRLTAAQLQVSSGEVQTFEQVGTIDLPYLLYMNGLAGQIATGMDFSPDGARALIITYQSVVEVNFDFSRGLTNSRTWRPNADYRVFTIAPAVPQAEAVAYLPDGRSFLYDTEVVASQFVPLAPIPVEMNGRAPLFRVTCEAVSPPPPPAAAPAAAPAAPAAPAQPGGR